MQKIRNFNINQKYVINFVLYFFISLIILQLITHIPIIIQALIYLTTNITGFFIKLIYSDITINGFHIISKRGIDMEIIYECTGIYGIIVFVSASISTFWLDIFEKLKGILIGIAIIFFANILRLFSLFIISQEYPPAFDYFHTYFWQLFLIVTVILVYYIFFLKKILPTKVKQDRNSKKKNK
jgi:exosortase/archaeosortase family protein